LEQVLDEARAAAARPPDARGLGALERTSERLCDLYQGRFLDKSELPCVIRPREALHRRYLLAVERLGAAFETMGMLDRAQSVYEHALEVDPGSEWLYDSLGRVSKERQRTLSQ
jgi:tetratricopeptide (TPR) repeat protein